MRHPGLIAAAAAALVTTALLVLPSTGGSYTAKIANPQNTVGATSAFLRCLADYQSSTFSSNAYLEYSLAGTASSENDFSTMSDSGTYMSGHATTAAMSSSACPTDTGSSAPNFWSLNGSSDWLSTSKSFAAPGDFTLVVWFRTTQNDTTKAQYLFGLNSGQTTATGGAKDRQLYVDINGYLDFAVYNNGQNGACNANTRNTTYEHNVPVVNQAITVNDGAWHQAVGVSTASNGTQLWLDGVEVATDPYSSDRTDAGYWRLGAGPLDGFPNAGNNAAGSNWFNGSLRFAAAYRIALSTTQIGQLYKDGKPGS